MRGGGQRLDWVGVSLVAKPIALAEPPDVDYTITEADVAAVWRRLVALARKQELLEAAGYEVKD